MNTFLARAQGGMKMKMLRRICTRNFSKFPQIEPPPFVDWREKGVITPVKNQRSCGTCWAFAAVGAIEAATKIKRGGSLLNLSVQELVYMRLSTNGCRGGSVVRAFGDVIRSKGLVLDKDYPYKGCPSKLNRRCENKPWHAVGPSPHLPRYGVINDYATVRRFDEKELQRAVASQPVVASISTIGLRQYKEKGIFKANSWKFWWSLYPGHRALLPKHAILIVGYGTLNGIDYWLIKNSWGKNFGDNCYFMIERNSRFQIGVLGITVRPSYPIIHEGCQREVADANKDESHDGINESIMRLSSALVHSRQPEDVQRGIAMLEAALTNPDSPLQKREKLYLIAVGYYRSGEYPRSWHFLDKCLEISPDWRQPLSLKKTVEERMITKDWHRCNCCWCYSRDCCCISSHSVLCGNFPS